MAKPTFNVESEAELTKLFVQGDVTVQHADIVKEFFLQSTERTTNETLHLNQITRIDTAGVQIIYLWKKKLEEQSRKADITLPENEDLLEILKKTGITKIL